MCQLCTCCKFVESVRISPAHFQTAVDKSRCSWKADSVFTSGFGASWKVPKESTLQVVTGVGTTCVDEQNFEERTRKPTTSESERQFAGSKLAVRKIQFLKLSKTGNYLVTLGLVERAQVQYSKTKATLQDQDCSIVGE